MMNRNCTFKMEAEPDSSPPGSRHIVPRAATLLYLPLQSGLESRIVELSVGYYEDIREAADGQ
jgi:hypothetical protein